MTLGKALNLYIAPINTSGIRESKETLELKESFGVVDDKFAGNSKKIDRSVMIVGDKPDSMAKDAEIKLPTAALGENILLSFDPHELPISTKLLIGSAIIEITARCTLCSHLTQYHEDLPKLILKHRGIYCKVIKSGIINKNDKVSIVSDEEI